MWQFNLKHVHIFEFKKKQQQTLIPWKEKVNNEKSFLVARKMTVMMNFTRKITTGLMKLEVMLFLFRCIYTGQKRTQNVVQTFFSSMGIVEALTFMQQFYYIFKDIHFRLNICFYLYINCTLWQNLPKDITPGMPIGWVICTLITTKSPLSTCLCCALNFRIFM